MADRTSRLCRPALEHRSFTDSSAVAELRRTTRAGAAFHHEFAGRGRGGGPFSFRYERNRIAKDERATVRGCVARQLSSRTCRTPPLPAARRFRKLSISEQGVHRAERNRPKAGFADQRADAAGPGFDGRLNAGRLHIELQPGMLVEELECLLRT